MKTALYLKRIGMPEQLAPTKDNLFALQRAHLHAVPYENLDILLGIPIALDEDALYQKIVMRGRGGYCFELNELFGRLLRALGYAVEDYFARFLADQPDSIPKRRHHVLKVFIEGCDTPYLCDVGVGVGSPNYPIALLEGVEQTQGEKRYRMARDSFLGWILEEQKRGEWRRLFSFTEEKQLPWDFTAISFFCEKSPESPFNKSPMVAIRTEDGRKSLDANVFKRFSGEIVKTFTVEDPVQMERMLFEWFGIQVPWAEHVRRNGGISG